MPASWPYHCKLGGAALSDGSRDLSRSSSEGVVGAAPSLLDLDPFNGDLSMTIDFRRVYATVLESWLGVPPAHVLGGTFEVLPLFRS
jgi:uncharacterized protein (DUF1501 family)